MRPREDRSNPGMEDTDYCQRNPVIPRILQLLPSFYRSLQPSGQAPDKPDEERYPFPFQAGLQSRLSIIKGSAYKRTDIAPLCG